MSNKNQYVTMLREEFNRWQEVLAGMDEEQIVSPQLPSNLSVKDVMAHLRAWQQRSIARLEAALLNQEPDFPRWPADLHPDVDDDVDRVNAWIYETHRDLPWPSVYRDWRDGFLRFLELGEAIPEQDLLDPDRYPWLHGYPLSYVLLSSYRHHHKEHLEPLLDWLQRDCDPVGDGQTSAGSGRPGMIANRSMPPGTIIPELAYGDVDTAVSWLSRVFGFQERLRIGNHRSQLVVGDASVVATRRTSNGGSQPLECEATHSLMVRVADVDGHYEHVKESGARILYAPETYPYGERQYSVEDLGGHRWTFSQSVADVDPEDWGGRPARSK